MISSRRVFHLLMLAVGLFPGAAAAQTTVRTFDQLQNILKPKTLLAVTDETGAESRGTVTEVSATTLTLLEVTRRVRVNGTWETRSMLKPEDRQFEASRVVEVSRVNAA